MKYKFIFNEQLMTGHLGNSEFCFPEGQGEKILTLPERPVINDTAIFLYLAIAIEERVAERGRPIFGAKLKP